jgi:UV DNA damage repair endonuclease
MYEVLKADLRPNTRRIASVLVKYYDLVMNCDICIYKNEKLWVRMPEVWMTPDLKVRFAYWDGKEKSEEFQDYVLKKVFDMIGLDIEMAVKLKTEAFAKKKRMTRLNKTVTLTEQKITPAT